MKKQNKSRHATTTRRSVETIFPNSMIHPACIFRPRGYWCMRFTFAKKYMTSFTSMLGPLKKATEQQIDKWSSELNNIITTTIQKEALKVDAYVHRLRSLNPTLPPEKLAKRIINRRSCKAGGIGAICGLGGFLTMPITMPADMYYTFRIQARMVLAIALIYEWDILDEETHTDILLVMGGTAGINAAKGVGLQVGKEWGKKFVQGQITRETMKRINKVVSRKIITKAGEKSLTSFTKLIPIVGAPIGGAFDFCGTQFVGRTALAFYQG